MIFSGWHHSFLNLSSWRLSLYDSSYAEECKCIIPDSFDSNQEFEHSIPDDVHSTLIRHNIIEHPYNKKNELDCQWVAYCDWKLGCEFLCKDILSAKQTYSSRSVSRSFLDVAVLYFFVEVFDSVGEVRVNGKLLGVSKSAFIPLKIALHKLEEVNVIEVILKSPVKVAAHQSATYPYSVPHTTSPVQSMHRNFVRKVQCHSGWDWGPCIMCMGMYGEVAIVAQQGICLDSIRVHTRVLAHTSSLEVGSAKANQDLFKKEKDEEWNLVIEGKGFCKQTDMQTEVKALEDSVSLGLKMDLDKGYMTDISDEIRDVMSTKPKIAVQECDITMKDKGFTYRIVAKVTHVARWWTHDLGIPTCYLLDLMIGGCRYTRIVGFRTLEWSIKKDEWGQSMSLYLNGLRVICKGANWIPTDALPAMQTDDRYVRCIDSAVAAHMNMIRVWGGGQYERDSFYELCDKRGILLWHDFMFSCALYPSDKNFLALVDKEIQYQLNRLQTHPCIALWCGNNENLGALKWFKESQTDRDRYLVDYDRLTEETIGNRVRSLDPQRVYWPSSPSAGTGEYSDNWHDDSKGDMHYWSVWHEGKSFESYYEVIPRFCSEFGFQSYPSLAGVSEYLEEDEYNIASPSMEHHQKNPRGNSIILETFARYYRVPQDFESMLYLSQVQQAQAIKTAVEYWRCHRSICSGMLYWQLHDVWPVSSWSSIEYPHTWKLLHYSAREFFSPLMICAIPAQSEIQEHINRAHAQSQMVLDTFASHNAWKEIQIFAVNDTRFTHEVCVRYTVMSSRAEILCTQVVNSLLHAQSSSCVATVSVRDLGEHAHVVMLEMELAGCIYSNIFWLVKPKSIELVHPQIDIQDIKEGIELTSSALAFNVALMPARNNTQSQDQSYGHSKNSQIRNQLKNNNPILSKNNFFLFPHKKYHVHGLTRSDIEAGYYKLYSLFDCWKH